MKPRHLIVGLIMIIKNIKKDTIFNIDIDSMNEKMHAIVSGIDDDVVFTSLQRFGNIYKKWERIIDEQHVA
ncbi:MAG TPA: hypothetical protein PLI62_12630 [Spirochaetota bacterium]|nr:hypothetical protein [Spirochaetota bacterium]